ncbi:MAG: diguanylate cyclase [Xanthomonadales bacterium]|nr:diguanylate cyclase [Xanthomonadales bacterium]
MVEALRAFYCDVVGLSVGPRPSFRRFGYWLYAGPKDVLHLTESSADERRAVSVRSTFDHVAFSCVDSAAYEARLQSAGIAYESDIVPGTGQVQLFFSDPAGNGVELNFSAS